MDRAIKSLRAKSLSNFDIMRICDGKVNIVTYPELSEYSSIDDVLGKYGAAIILYLTKKKYGHWVAIFKVNRHQIEFFDPYGLRPDDQLDFINQHFRVENNEKKPHLSYLLYNSPYTVTYNDDRLQKMIKDVSTCGRWCAIRIVLRKLKLPDFVRIFKNNKCYDPDFFVTAISSFI